MKRVTKSVLLAATIALPTTVLANPQVAPATMVVLDASGSMWGRLQGRSKIEIARSVLKSSTQNLPENTSVGLVAYGHRRQKDCGDIELVLPLGNNKRSLGYVANGIVPKGRTPITDAVRLAADQMQNRYRQSSVILISDGLETCGGDPCALARDLSARGLSFTTHVIGFNFETKTNRQSISCLAEETGGLFLEANNEKELSRALDKVFEVSNRERFIFTPAVEAEREYHQPVIDTRPAVVAPVREADPLYDSRGKNDGAVIYDHRPNAWRDQ